MCVFLYWGVCVYVWECVLWERQSQAEVTGRPAELAALTFPFSHPSFLLRQRVLLSDTASYSRRSVSAAAHSRGNPRPTSQQTLRTFISPHFLPFKPPLFLIFFPCFSLFSCHAGDCPTLFQPHKSLSPLAARLGMGARYIEWELSPSVSTWISPALFFPVSWFLLPPVFRLLGAR